MKSADALESADAPRSASLNAPESDKEFLTGYMTKLAREQQIIKMRNKGIIYMPVGTMKFTLMCMCVPFHGYEFWWIYKNLVCQKERKGDLLSPMWRLNMLLLYLRSLLKGMQEEGVIYGLDKTLPIEKVILYWILLALCMLFPPPASIFGVFSFAPFIYVNDYLIKLNRVANPDLKLNEGFTLSNYLVIIVGGAWFALNMYLNYYIH